MTNDLVLEAAAAEPTARTLMTTDQLAEQYFRLYGVMSKVTAKRVAQDLANDNMDLGGHTKQQISEALKLVNAISYSANPKLYDTTGDIQNPETGKQLLASPGLKSPAAQQHIAQMLGPDHDYSKGIAQLHAAQQKGTPIGAVAAQEATLIAQPDTSLMDNLTAPPASGHNSLPAQHQNLTQSASGNGYEYSGAPENRNPQRKRPQPQGTVTMNASGGGTYTSTLNSGDSRSKQSYLNKSSPPAE